MRNVFCALALVVGMVPVAGAAEAASSLLQMPSDAKLVGMVQVDEIRQFPELRNQGRKLERVAGAAAVDRVFQLSGKYDDSVKFFDQQFKQIGASTIARVVTPSSTAWTVQRPSGAIVNVVVRNTSPVTVESIESAEEQQQMQMRRRQPMQNQPMENR